MQKLTAGWHRKQKGVGAKPVPRGDPEGVSLAVLSDGVPDQAVSVGASSGHRFPFPKPQTLAEEVVVPQISLRSSVLAFQLPCSHALSAVRILCSSSGQPGGSRSRSRSLCEPAWKEKALECSLLSSALASACREGVAWELPCLPSGAKGTCPCSCPCCLRTPRQLRAGAGAPCLFFGGRP